MVLSPDFEIARCRLAISFRKFQRVPAIFQTHLENSALDFCKQIHRQCFTVIHRDFHTLTLV